MSETRPTALCACGKRSRLVRGQCHNCYMRWWNRQPPLRVQIPAAERFAAKVTPSPDGCLLWTGYRLPKGYGQFWPEHGTRTYAHRWAWEQVNGPIPAGLTIDHLCERPPCVNVAHLEVVTRAENSRRQAARKRAAA